MSVAAEEGATHFELGRGGIRGGVRQRAVGCELDRTDVGIDHEISPQVSNRADRESARQVATATNDDVKALADAANSIGDVVKLIQAIAEQTNLLALNATIEAARAGEAGRGFAVVASEVKTLAGQTAKATEQISSQIQNVQVATTRAVQAIGSITKTIDEINAIATTIANAVQEQTAATQEISHNVRQTAAGTQEVATNIVRVKDAAQHTGQTASQLTTAAATLKDHAQQLSAEVGGFLETVRAA